MKFALIGSVIGTVSAFELDLMSSLATENHRPVKKASMQDVFEKPAETTTDAEDEFQKSRHVKSFSIMDHYKKYMDLQNRENVQKQEETTSVESQSKFTQYFKGLFSK